MKNDEMLRRVVENALDFLGRAVEDAKERPKHSIINFYSAVELFLKARLMVEHWSLVVAREPDRAAFEAGNFVSVSLEAAASRLDKVVGDGLTADEMTAFDDVRKHRNRMVHFFHGTTSAKETGKLQREAVRQQLSAWYYLQALLTKRWKPVFESWGKEIAEINTRLRSLHAYLQVVFERVRPEIERKKKGGALFGTCPICTYPAIEHGDALDTVFPTSCLVCEAALGWLRIECPSCGKVVDFQGEGFADCKCGETFTPKNLVDVLIGGKPGKDDDGEWDQGHCGDCDGFETVVKTGNDNYVCTHCLGVFDDVTRCGWCNVPNTGDMEESMWDGCNWCEGHSGHLASKDD